ncbi:MAG TPA: hypothetical protein VFB27_02630, partial [Opitutaceae bacterium]|nr:hypothetical protein [Opitutaceae bacterium]
MKAETEPSQTGPGAPLLASGETFASISENISRLPLERPQTRFWWIGFAVAFALVLLLFAAIGWLFLQGVGVWGINIPVAWGFAIVNF